MVIGCGNSGTYPRSYLTFDNIYLLGLLNSAHDIARDFYSSGAAEVTMVQRSATAVVSSTASIPRLQYNTGYREGGPPTEVGELRNTLQNPFDSHLRK